jgi:hypothetical protein
MDQRGEAPGACGIGTDRSLQIRQEIERIARFPDQEGVYLTPTAKVIARAAKSSPKESGPGFAEKKHRLWAWQLPLLLHRVKFVHWVNSSVWPAGMSILLRDSDRKFQHGRQII